MNEQDPMLLEEELLVAEGGPSPSESADRPPVRSGLSFAAMSFVVGAVIGLGSSVVTSRLYGIDVIGQYALVAAPYLITTQISQVNEGTAFVRLAADQPARDLRVSALFRLVLAFSAGLTTLVAAIVVVVGTSLLRGPVGQPDLVLPMLVVMCGYVLFDNLSWNIDSVLSAYRAGKVLFWARTAQLASFLAAALVAAAFTQSVWGLVAATLVSFVVPLAVRLSAVGRFVRLRLPPGTVRAHRHELPPMLRFGLVLVPAVLVGAVTGQAGTWVVGSLGSTVVIGGYARALGLATKFNEAGFRIAEILMPGIVERRARGDDAGARHLLDRAFRLSAVPLLALAAAGGGAGTGVLKVFGEGFDRANVILALLSLSCVLLVLNYIQQQGILAVGRPGIITVLSLSSGAVTVVSMVAGQHLLGATGVAAAYVVGKLAVLVYIDRRVGHELGAGRGLTGNRVLAGLALLWGAGYATAWGVVQLSSGIVGTAAAIAVGGAASLVVALVLGIVPEEDRDRLVGILRARLAR